MPRPTQQAHGVLDAALTKALVDIKTHSLGQVPASASTFHHGNVVVTLMHDMLNKAELILSANGSRGDLAATRVLFRRAVEAELRAAVETITGRTVTVMLADESLEPDIEATIFILDGPP